jgi:hypothetical protein
MYTKLDKDINGFQVFKISDGQFKDIEFTFGSVNVEESTDKEECKIFFTYNIVSGEILDKKDFEKLLSTILNSIMFEQLNEGTLIYGGGTDGDSIQDCSWA